MSEFKPTHRYDGQDDGVFGFVDGDEVMFLKDWHIDNENGVYTDKEGNEQVVYKHCMEEI